MAVGDSSPRLAVPTITEEDLKAFHAKHFATSHTPACPSQLWDFNDQLDSAAIHVADQRENDSYDDTRHDFDDSDDLGYYADGVKRTLTDEQIAMFRHSEIHRLLLERDKERELASSEADTQPVNREAVLSGSGSESPRDSPAAMPQQMQPPRQHSRLAVSSKRKRTKPARKTSYKNEQQHYTPNRTARELDEVKSHSVDLDY